MSPADTTFPINCSHMQHDIIPNANQLTRMRMANKCGALTDLPTDLLNYVVSFLDIGSHDRLSRVNTTIGESISRRIHVQTLDARNIRCLPKLPLFSNLRILKINTSDFLHSKLLFLSHVCQLKYLFAILELTILLFCVTGASFPHVNIV